MNEDPVLLMMTSRSGSSLVAHIFERHGLYNGSGTRVQTHGYHTHENRAIIKGLNQMLVRETPFRRVLAPGRELKDFRGVFEADVPPDTPWMMKIGVEVYELMRDAFPRGRFVFVRRNTESIVASLCHKTGSDPAVVRPITEGRMALIESIAAHIDAPIVDTDALARGDYVSLKEAFEKCKLKLDLEIPKQVYQPKLWRF